MKSKKILIPIIILSVIIILSHQTILDIISIDGNPNITTSEDHLVFFEEYRMYFRAPIEQSETIQLYPDEESIRELFYKKHLETVQIAILDNVSDTGNYILVSHSLAVDIPLILEKKIGFTPEIKAVGVSSIEEAKQIASQTKPLIMLLSPSNKTFVTLDENIVLLEGESFEFKNNDYLDLDLAAGKLMLTLMEDYQKGR